MIEWRMIPGFDAYRISEHGDVHRVTRSRTSFPGPRKATEDNNGYLMIELRSNGKCTSLRIHTLVTLAFIGPRPSRKYEVAHRDGNRSNNHYSNLRWATRAENMADAARHSTLRRGENSFQAILTEKDVIEVRRKYLDEGITALEMARLSRFSRETISDAINGNTWRHVTEIPATDIKLRRKYFVGEDHSLAKLTEDDIIKIRQKFANGETMTSIANSMSVTRQNIRFIVRRNTWKHVA